MKDKILKLITDNRGEYWDEHSTTPVPPISDEENEAIIKGDNQLAEDIIKLFE